jgi:hypothetical protein
MPTNCLTIFFTHGVPNTPQVKPTDDNIEAYFTQHVSNVTLCRCQIYSAPAPGTGIIDMISDTDILKTR